VANRVADVHRHHLLLVEDHDDSRMAVAEVLRLDGHQVTTAAGGEEALDVLRAGLAPCLVLLDLQMPGTSGQQFRQLQLRDRRIASVPVAALSGHGGIAQQAEAMGIAGYLPKPIDLDRLLAVLRRTCRLAA
jgi:CheY-like chemotaxis protein